MSSISLIGLTIFIQLSISYEQNYMMSIIVPSYLEMLEEVYSKNAIWLYFYYLAHYQRCVTFFQFKHACRRKM